MFYIKIRFVKVNTSILIDGSTLTHIVGGGALVATKKVKIDTFGVRATGVTVALNNALVTRVVGTIVLDVGFGIMSLLVSVMSLLVTVVGLLVNINSVATSLVVLVVMVRLVARTSRDRDKDTGSKEKDRGELHCLR